MSKRQCVRHLMRAVEERRWKMKREEVEIEPADTFVECTKCNI